MLAIRVRGRLAKLLFAGGFVLAIGGWVTAFLSTDPATHTLGILFFVVAVAICSVGVALFGAFEHLAVARILQDLPTAKIRSAPQGYVELRGRVERGTRTLACPECHRNCLWYRFVHTEKVAAGKYRTTIRTPPPGSAPPMVINDGTGTCVIDMADATFVAPGPVHNHVFPGDSITVLGEFRTRSKLMAVPGSITPAMRIDELHSRLMALKADPKMMARLDVDRDGAVTQREWDAARHMVKGQIERDIAASPPPELSSENHIGAPSTDADRLPFVVFKGNEAQAIKSARWSFAASIVGMVLVGSFVGLWGLAMVDSAERQQIRAEQRAAKKAAKAQARAAKAARKSERQLLVERDKALSADQRWPEIVAMWDEYIYGHLNDGYAHYMRARAKHFSGDRAGALEDGRRSCELGYEFACQTLERLGP